MKGLDENGKLTKEAQGALSFMAQVGAAIQQDQETITRLEAEIVELKAAPLDELILEAATNRDECKAAGEDGLAIHWDRTYRWLVGKR